jgi:hypothetical protein
MCALLLVVVALGVLPLMVGVLCDLVLAPFRYELLFAVGPGILRVPMLMHGMDGAGGEAVCGRVQGASEDHASIAAAAGLGAGPDRPEVCAPHVCGHS